MAWPIYGNRVLLQEKGTIAIRQETVLKGSILSKCYCFAVVDRIDPTPIISLNEQPLTH